MWVAKIKINGEKALIGSRTKKFNVSVSGYPISSFIKRDGIFVYLVGFVFGEEKNKKGFIRDLKKDRRVLHIEGKEDFIIAQIKESLKVRAMYRHRIIHLQPVFINEEGFEFWTIGSWNRKDLEEFIKLVEKQYNGKLISIKQEKITNLSIVSVQPKLTNKQKKALELAIKHGYYKYPRKTSLEKLAKMMDLSYSTYQAHLRKAEQKILPFFFKRF